MQSRPDLSTQQALARRSGVAQSTIGRILRGEVDPQADSLHRMAAALGIPIGRLFNQAQAASNQLPRERNGGEVHSRASCRGAREASRRHPGGNSSR
jgi:transcriptional regulator with XRE-family HTH domain